MSKKITRRMVLGTIIGGLIVAPFGISYLQRKQKHVMLTMDYERFDVTQNMVTTDLTQNELQEVLNIFFNERDMWLKFLGFSADVRMVIDPNEFGEKAGMPRFDQQAYITLEYKKSHQAQQLIFPWDKYLTCANSQTKNIYWTNVWKADSKKSTFAGKNDFVEFKECQSFMDKPIEMFYYTPNRVLMQGLKHFWKITKFEGDEGYYSFKPKDNFVTGDGKILPELTFRDGMMYSYIPAKEKNMPYLEYTWGKREMNNGLLFPSEIKLSIQNNHKLIPGNHNPLLYAKNVTCFFTQTKIHI